MGGSAAGRSGGGQEGVRRGSGGRFAGGQEGVRKVIIEVAEPLLHAGERRSGGQEGVLEQGPNRVRRGLKNRVRI
eukprot:908272-Prorocentrum_minimum.AAC.1